MIKSAVGFNKGKDTEKSQMMKTQTLPKGNKE